MSEVKWKPIPEYNNRYEISTNGQVRRKKLNNEYTYLSASLQDDGYMRVLLSSKDQKIKFVAIHRLIAEAFIPNPENKKYVIHQDRNKQHNDISNLSWATWEERKLFNKDNPNYFKRNNSHPRYKVICTTTGEVFDSLRAASEKFAISSTNISLCIKQQRSTRTGYRFEYIKN